MHLIDAYHVQGTMLTSGQFWDNVVILDCQSGPFFQLYSTKKKFRVQLRMSPNLCQPASRLWPKPAALDFRNKRPGQKLPQAKHRAWLGSALFGLTWPGFWPQAGASTPLMDRDTSISICCCHGTCTNSSRFTLQRQVLILSSYYHNTINDFCYKWAHQC